jgi:hypothetical protein
MLKKFGQLMLSDIGILTGATGMIEILKEDGISIFSIYFLTLSMIRLLMVVFILPILCGIIVIDVIESGYLFSSILAWFVVLMFSFWVVGWIWVRWKDANKMMGDT